MITSEQLDREIDMIIISMKTAADSQREYSIGALSALLWVQGGGEVMRPQCFVRACATWDKARANEQTL